MLATPAQKEARGRLTRSSLKRLINERSRGVDRICVIDVAAFSGIKSDDDTAKLRIRITSAPRFHHGEYAELQLLHVHAEVGKLLRVIIGDDVERFENGACKGGTERLPRHVFIQRSSRSPTIRRRSSATARSRVRKHATARASSDEAKS
jgi:hypothetical protein